MSSLTPEWETPRPLFEALDKEFGPLQVDVCATAENTKLPRFWSKADDGLAQDWTGLRCWMNPPYGRGIGAWVQKARTSSAITVCLLPARTDTAWWHDNVPGRAAVVRFLRGRVRFSGAGSAPFPSVVVVFDNLTPRGPGDGGA
jgi:site-specific DNA-methyltransferase (adenine-specific)